MLSLVADECASYTIPSTLHEWLWEWSAPKGTSIWQTVCNDLLLRAKNRIFISVHHVFGHVGIAGNECADIAASFGTVVLSPNVTPWRGAPSGTFASRKCFKKTIVSPTLQSVYMKHVLAGSWGIVVSPCSGSVGSFLFNPEFRPLSRSVSHHFFFVVHQFCTEVSLYALFAQLVADRPFHVLRGCVGVGMDAASLPPR